MNLPNIMYIKKLTVNETIFNTYKNTILQSAKSHYIATHEFANLTKYIIAILVLSNAQRQSAVCNMRLEEFANAVDVKFADITTKVVRVQCFTKRFSKHLLSFNSKMIHC